MPTPLLSVEWVAGPDSAKLEDSFQQAAPFLNLKDLPWSHNAPQVPPRLIQDHDFDQQWQVVLDSIGTYVNDLGQRVAVKKKNDSLSEANDIRWAAYNVTRYFLLASTMQIRIVDNDHPPPIIWIKSLDLMLRISDERIRHLLLPEMMQARLQADTRITIAPAPNPYPYPALLEGPSSIRLVVLLAAAESHFNIVCKLCNGTLGQDKYEALSYVWGDASKKRTITVNDLLFQATENLEVALRHLRYRDRHRVLWIDSMCINQNDPEERNAQVQKMDQIYSSSQRTIVWLGPEYEGSRAMLELMGRFGDLQDSLIKDEPPLTPFSTALNRLLQRPWFTRIWCIQEFILAQDVVFQCGQGSFGQKDLAKILVIKNELYSLSPEPQNDIGERERTVKVFRQSIAETYNLFFWKANRLLNSDISVLNLLYTFGDWAASDPRDKVFGFYGIVQEENIDRVVLKPDYKKNAGEVYTEIAVYFLRKYRNLSILSMASQPAEGLVDVSTLHLLPSWVPDWRDAQRFGRERNCRAISFHKKDRGTPLFDGIYNASLGVEATPVDLQNLDQVLVLDGINVDTIETIGDVLHGFDVSNNFDHALSIISKSEEIAGLSQGGHYRFSGQPVREAWWRTLLGDRMDDWKGKVGPRIRIPTEQGQHRVDWEQRFLSGDDFNTTMGGLTIKGLMCGRRFFKTAKGMFGLAPHSTRQGDQVVVLFGGTVPFIIRRYDKWYHILGEGYVHGIMDGEVIHQPRTKQFQDLEVERFHLA